MKQKVLRIHPNDNVLVALTSLAKGEQILYGSEQYLVEEAVPVKHKFFTADLYPGDAVIMYGVMIGKVQCAVNKGGLVKTANTSHAAAEYVWRNTKYSWTPPDVSAFEGLEFDGFYPPCLNPCCARQPKKCSTGMAPVAA